MCRSRLLACVIGLIALSYSRPTHLTAADDAAKGMAESLRTLDGNALPREGESAKLQRQMVTRDVRARIQAANQRDSKAWQQVKGRADWEKFRDARLEALRASLGNFPTRPADLKVRV